MLTDSIVIVTPAVSDANNGNWQTANRWAALLKPAYRVDVADQWNGDEADLLIALHARRSAPSIDAWRRAHPTRPLLVVLTGTDLYRDIDNDPAARRSLAQADRLVVLNELGADRLPSELRPKCHVVLQSCVARQTMPKSDRQLRALMVGHLREEKDPATYMRAVARLAGRTDFHFDHVGAALDPALGAAADALAMRQPSYCWFGALPHATVRKRIQTAHVLVHASRMEGGAHVVIEAMRSGTPVLASRIDGNLGLLGADYPGTFDVGDDAALAALLLRARDDPDMLSVLKQSIAARAPLFAPEAERASLLRLVDALLAPGVRT